MAQDAPIEIIERPWRLGAMMLVIAIAVTATMVVAAIDGNRLAVVCSGILLIGAVIAAAKSVRYARLTLNTDGSANFAVRDFRGWHHHEFTAGDLRAGVEHYRMDGGVSGRVMLLVDGSDGVTRIPFAGHFGSPEKASETVSRIMAWRERTNFT